MKPGRTYIPLALISLPFFFSFGRLLSTISTPGYPTVLIDLIIFCSITISTGPNGGLPFPFTSIAPRMISWLNGPSESFFS